MFHIFNRILYANFPGVSTSLPFSSQVVSLLDQFACSRSVCSFSPLFNIINISSSVIIRLLLASITFKLVHWEVLYGVVPCYTTLPPRIFIRLYHLTLLSYHMSVVYQYLCLYPMLFIPEIHISLCDYNLLCSYIISVCSNCSLSSTLLSSVCYIVLFKLILL